MRSIRIACVPNTPEKLGEVHSTSLPFLEWLSTHNKSSAGHLIYDMLSVPGLSNLVVVAYDGNTNFILGAALVSLGGGHAIISNMAVIYNRARAVPDMLTYISLLAQEKGLKAIKIVKTCHSYVLTSAKAQGATIDKDQPDWLFHMDLNSDE